MSESTLRQRKETSSATEKVNDASTEPPVVPVPELASFDFALVVSSPHDAKTNEPTAEAQLNLKRLIKTLDFNGFKISVRADSTPDSVLVFVKLADYESVLSKAKKVDALYLVTQLDDQKPTIADRLRIVFAKLVGPISEGGANITIAQDKWSFVTGVVPVATWENSRQAYADFRKVMYNVYDPKIHKAQMQFLLENFGSRNAIYFRTVNLYLPWLGTLAFTGIACHYLLGDLSNVFSVLNLLIGVSFYLTWYGYQKKWAKEWSTVNVAKVDVSRTDKKDPPYKVLIRKVLFAPIAFTEGAHLFAGQFACFLLEIFIGQIYEGPGKSLLGFVPTIIVCSIVPILTAIYSIIVNKYLDYENNPTRSTQNMSYLVKMFLFNFLSSYVPLLITSFLYLPSGYRTNEYLTTIDTYADTISNSTTYIEKIPVKTENFVVDTGRLNTQFKYFVLTNQVIGLATEYLVPIIVPKVLALIKKPTPVKIADEDSEVEFLKTIRHQATLGAYEADDEFRQLVIQFGFLILFGPIWSIGATISFVVELIESKADYFKVLRLSRPPIPDRAESAYPWPLFLKVLLFIGSFTSTCITIMYNGDNIVASVDASSVEVAWFSVLPPALINTFAVQLIIYTGEAIIDEYFTDPGSEIAKREQQLRSILADTTEKPSINDVDTLIKEASTIPTSIIVKTEKTKKQE